MSTKGRKGGPRERRPRPANRRRRTRPARPTRAIRAGHRRAARSSAPRRKPARAVRSRRRSTPSGRRPVASSRPGHPQPPATPATRLPPRGGTPIIVTTTPATFQRPGAPPARQGVAENRPTGPATAGNGPGAALARTAPALNRAQPASPANAPPRPSPGSQTFRPVASSVAPASPIDRRPSRRPATAPRKRQVCAMILAAGMGKRMQSQSTKLVHNVAGRPMVRHVVEAARSAGMSRTVVVVGNQADEVRRAVGETDKRIGFAYQDSQRGTGHAVLSAEGHLLGYEGDVLILNGDLPALLPETLKTFIDFHRASGAPLSLMTAVVDVPGGYGRVIRTYNGDVSRIVEEADATVEEKAIKEINCGIYCVDTTWLWDPLKRARADNAQREIYLTDLVEILRRDCHKVAAYRHPDAEEVLGSNDRRELSAAARALHRRKVLGLMEAGVTVLDPETTFVDVDVKVGQDTVLEPGVMLLGATEIGRGVTIGMGSRVDDSVVG